MVLLSAILTVIVQPAIWLAAKVVYEFFILLLLMIVYRIFATGFTLWSSESNRFRGRQLRPVNEKQLILVTGASSGIGLALSKHLYKIGYSVAAAYWPEAQEPGIEELRKISNTSSSKNRLFLVELDVCKQDSIEAAYKQVEELIKQHRLELFALVNNAGLGSLQPFAWLQRETIQRIIDTNLSGSLLMTREFLPLLAKKTKQDGETNRLIFVSSGLGFVPGATYATYGVTKAGQIYLAKCLNLELKERYGVQSVAVIPHNFIKNTNICKHNVRNIKAAWDEIKPIEREIYEDEFKQHCELARSLEEATKERLQEAASSSKRSNRRSSETLSWAERLINGFKVVLASLRGENLILTLEDSGVLEGFELALRLKNPPEIVFGGDSAFQLIVGSLLLILPVSFNGLLSSSVAPSLYR